MIKRVFDLAASSIGLLFLLPLFLVIAIWIKYDSKGPIFFKQVRVGLHGDPFKIHKFRTMIVDAESKGRLTVGTDSRITPSGYVLRKYKLDELPQLIDVLIGNMSLVGPRPEVQEFINKYPENIRAKVLSVKPGITDLASIRMVDENSILAEYEDPKRAYIDFILPIKQEYYIEYVDKQSLWLDIKIIFLTIEKIIFR